MGIKSKKSMLLHKVIGIQCGRSSFHSLRCKNESMALAVVLEVDNHEK